MSVYVKVSCNVGNLLCYGICPKVFQVIEPAQFGNEDMYHDVSVVHCYPVGVSCAFYKVGFASFLDSHGFADGVLNGERLVGCASLAYYEIPAYRIFNTGQINYCYTFSFALLNSFNDALYYAFSFFFLAIQMTLFFVLNLQK